MILKGKNFVLRYPKISDLNSYHKNKNDKTLEGGFNRFEYPYSKLEAKKHLIRAIESNRKKNKTREIFVIDIEGKAVGEVGLEDIIPRLKAKSHSFIGKEYRNKGIVTSARKLLIEYAFKKYKLRRIYCIVRTANKASKRVTEKVGYKLEGIAKNDVLKKGKYYDNYVYAITK